MRDAPRHAAPADLAAWIPHDPPHVALATTTATVAPPGGRVTQAATAVKTKPAAAEVTVPAAVSATHAKPKQGLSGFTAVFAIVSLLAIA